MHVPAGTPVFGPYTVGGGAVLPRLRFSNKPVDGGKLPDLKIAANPAYTPPDSIEAR